MNKFENVDILDFLEQIMLQNTQYYQSDFEIDRQVIWRYAGSDKTEDKNLLWMSRRCGTYCFRERDVFVKDTAQFITWIHYIDSSDEHILSYAVEIIGKEDGQIRGNLYELDYRQLSRRIKDKAVPVVNCKLLYENGEKILPVGMYFDSVPDPLLGKLESVEALPNDPEALKYVLQEERKLRHTKIRKARILRKNAG